MSGVLRKVNNSANLVGLWQATGVGQCGRRSTCGDPVSHVAMPGLFREPVHKAESLAVVPGPFVL